MMVLVDTAVWIDHLRNRNARLDELLLAQRVLTHPFVIGEIACGRLDDRSVIGYMQGLEKVRVAEDGEVLQFIERRRLAGRGAGWVDVHLLASAVLTRCTIWTTDRALNVLADALGIIMPEN